MSLVLCVLRGKKKKCGVIVVYLLVIRIAFFPHFLLRQRAILFRYGAGVAVQGPLVLFI